MSQHLGIKTAKPKEDKPLEQCQSEKNFSPNPSLSPNLSTRQVVQCLTDFVQLCRELPTVVMS